MLRFSFAGNAYESPVRDELDNLPSVMPCHSIQTVNALYCVQLVCKSAHYCPRVTIAYLNIRHVKRIPFQMEGNALNGRFQMSNMHMTKICTVRIEESSILHVRLLLLGTPIFVFLMTDLIRLDGFILIDLDVARMLALNQVRSFQEFRLFHVRLEYLKIDN